MTILETQKFHEHDKKEYDILNNEKFIERFWDRLSDGCYRFISIDTAQDLINKLANWYQFKYPESEFEIKEGKTKYLADLESICSSMNFKQLLLRLSWLQISFILATYPSFDVFENIDVDGKISKTIGYDAVLSYYFYNKNIDGETETHSEDNYFDVRATLDGKVFMEDLPSEFIINDDELTLEKLLEIMELLADDYLDYHELKESVLTHKLELKDRKEVLQLAALSMLYSENTTPEHGYERAKRFIEEFNENIPGLDLSTDQIDEIITRKYADEKRLAFTNKK